MARARRSWPAVLLSVVVLAMVVVALLLPWYHIERSALGITSDRQFELGDVRSVVAASSDSASFEEVTKSAYDDPPDFLEVGELMQMESVMLLAVLVLEVVFVMTCLAGARRAALIAGVASLALLTAAWVFFTASIEGAINSSAWVDEPGNAPISGFIGSSGVAVLGVWISTAWGPMVGWVLLASGSAVQFLALLAVLLGRGRATPSAVSSTTLN